MDCIDLKKRFGDRFKVKYEESYYAQYGPNARTEDPWYMIIPCENGHICPWGGSNLAACTNSAGRVANKLKALPFTEVAQDGDDGANVAFDVKHFEEVAKIMKPRKKRRRELTSEQRAELAARMRRINQARRPRSQASESVPESHPGAMPV